MIILPSDLLSNNWYGGKECVYGFTGVSEEGECMEVREWGIQKTNRDKNLIWQSWVSYI